MKRLKLTRMVRERRITDPEQPLPGDRCGERSWPEFPFGSVVECDGELTVYCTRHNPGVTTRYLECSKCRCKPVNNRLDIPVQGL